MFGIGFSELLIILVIGLALSTSWEACNVAG
jgi:hypothetical protein